LWLTKKWEEYWFDKSKLQKFLDKNKTLIFNYWYFGDEVGGEDGLTKILQQKENYLQNAKKVGNFLKDLNGSIALIMEPEFNKRSIIYSKENAKIFAQIIKDAILEIKKISPNILISICPMDTGKRNSTTSYGGFKRDSLGDLEEWEKTTYVIDWLIDYIDFITIQEMVSQFHKDTSNFPSNILVSHTKEEIGIAELYKRIENWAEFYNKRYNIGVLLGYIAIPENCWQDDNSNNLYDEGELIKNCWTDEMIWTLYNLKQNKEELFEKGLIGFAPMELFDDPNHDKGGYQFLSENEYSIGLIGLNKSSSHRNIYFYEKNLSNISAIDLLFGYQQYLFLKTGWNLCSLPIDTPFENFEAIWEYQDKKWKAHIKNISQNTLNSYGIASLQELNESLGYWVFVEKSCLLPFQKNTALLPIKSGWNLLGNINSNGKDINATIIWKYKNNRWEGYSKNKTFFELIEKKYDTFSKIYPTEGFWVFSD